MMLLLKWRSVPRIVLAATSQLSPQSSVTSIPCIQPLPNRIAYTVKYLDQSAEWHSSHTRLDLTKMHCPAARLAHRHARRGSIRDTFRGCASVSAGVARRPSKRCAVEPTVAAATVVVSKPVEDSPLVDTSSPQAALPQRPQQPTFKAVKQLRMRSAAAYLPHPEKESYGGEDAHFVSNISGGAIGVADGVGGWADSGVNPAEYSRTLMRVACAYVEGLDTRAVATSSSDSACSSLSSMDGCSPFGSADSAIVDPKGALDTAHKLTKRPGSATACVVQLCPERKALIAANLGDSGFIVVRNGEIAMRSSPKQHFFDCPLQFGSYPEYVDGTDTADDAELFHLPVLPGDVVIAGTDGLWDNVYSKEILELIPKTPEDVDRAADKIAQLARRHAADPDFASPYTAEAKAQGLDWPWWMKVMNTKLKDGKVQLGELTGGKMDDITVLVAMVEEVEVQVPELPAAEPAVSAAEDSSSSSNGNGNGNGVVSA